MRRHKLLGAPVRRAECASRKFFTATRRAVFFFAAQTVDAPSKSGLNYARSVSETVQYLFNEMLHEGGGTARERLARSGYTGAASEGSFDVAWKDNYPNTIPVDGGAADALQCAANCIGRNVFATGGQEKWKDGVEGGTLLHSANSAHYDDTAVDFRAVDAPSSKVLSCSANCGFRAGWWENWGNPHWHFQLNTSPNAKPPMITTDPLVTR